MILSLKNIVYLAYVYWKSYHQVIDKSSVVSNTLLHAQWIMSSNITKHHLKTFIEQKI